MTRRVLVTGSRDWQSREVIYQVLNSYVADTSEKSYDSTGQFVDWDTRDLVIVHGACPTGADHIADQWALSHMVTVEAHPAHWEKYGKRAGFLRNSEMVELGADICLAFIKGATMTADLAERSGIPVRRYFVTSPEQEPPTKEEN